MTDLNQPIARHKRGDTFHYIGTLPDSIDFTGVAVKSQVRLPNGMLVADLAATVSSGKALSLFKRDTQTWPPGVVKVDVQFTFPDKSVLSTSTGTFLIEEDNTQ